MNELEIFSNSDFGRIRMVMINESPWFVGRDVAQSLGYARTNAALSRLVDAKDKGIMKIPTESSHKVMIILNERGLYSLMMKSKQPAAKAFQRWIAEEVLPKIQNHDLCVTEGLKRAFSSSTLVAEKLKELRKERQKRLAVEKVLREQAPLVAFADAVEASKRVMMIGELARIIEQNGVPMNRNGLISWMKDHDFLEKTGTNENLPTEKAEEMKLFATNIKRTAYPDGSVTIIRTPLVTGKGQVYFISELLKDKEKSK